jgi:hypothetical protein
MEPKKMVVLRHRLDKSFTEAKNIHATIKQLDAVFLCDPCRTNSVL